MTSIKSHQKFFVLFEISQKSFRFSHRRDIAQIFEHLFQICNFIYVVNEIQKKIANTLNEIIEKYYDLRNQIYIIDEQIQTIESKMKNVIDIKKNLEILKNSINQSITITIVQILNQFVSRLKNKRNNFNDSILKLKKTKKISSSNAFKSYQNQIVFSIFLNFYIVQNARNNFQT